MNPIIGWRTVGYAAGANSPSENDAKAFDGLTWSFWRANGIGQRDFSINTPSAQTVDYVAIAGHNLAGSTVTLLVNNSVAGSTIVGSNRPFIFRFPQRTGTSFRIRTNKPTGPVAEVAVCYVGRALELERGIWTGHAPMRFNRDNRYLNNLSETGQLLGRKLISQGAVGDIAVDNLTSDWVRDEWEPFTLHAERRGFFFQHNPSEYPNEVAYCWTTGNSEASNAVPNGQKGLMSASVSVRGIV